MHLIELYASCTNEYYLYNGFGVVRPYLTMYCPKSNKVQRTNTRYSVTMISIYSRYTYSIYIYIYIPIKVYAHTFSNDAGHDAHTCPHMCTFAWYASICRHVIPMWMRAFLIISPLMVGDKHSKENSNDTSLVFLLNYQTTLHVVATGTYFCLCCFIV